MTLGLMYDIEMPAALAAPGASRRALVAFAAKPFDAVGGHRFSHTEVHCPSHFKRNWRF